MSKQPAQSLFAERLVQARELRGLSQRALGDLMGLGKDKGSTRINRYERQTSSVSLEALDELARALDVPKAYLVADTGAFADALLRLSQIDLEKRPEVIQLLDRLVEDPKLAARLLSAESPSTKAKSTSRRKA
ncbi:helix-turn-helix transcriptional regulator [Silanimonas sp.]|uniref:helix-turn-helix domain-containing protein n=1 Tax=Silanimonas sp. TaxID=1929290 RepID=UPI0022C6C3D2|nr:helix-turn-helix transcriptional regulator [Silanimonas sp.]MCZ8061762.1 helix-turn-helix transcriptional regulator [Silanimonas sp.]